MFIQLSLLMMVYLLTKSPEAHLINVRNIFEKSIQRTVTYAMKLSARITYNFHRVYIHKVLQKIHNSSLIFYICLLEIECTFGMEFFFFFSFLYNIYIKAILGNLRMRRIYAKLSRFDFFSFGKLPRL